MQFAPLTPGNVITIRGEKGARVVGARSPLALKIADLMSRLVDLQRTVAYCERLKIIKESDEAPQEIMDALAEAALMSYGRAFSRDFRSSAVLSLNSIDTIPGSPREIHAHFIFLRNKFLAHSENKYEEVLVGLTLAEYPAKRSVTGIRITHLSAFDFSGENELVRLANALLRDGRSEVERLSQALLAESEHLDPASVYALEDLSYTMPPPEAAGVRRSRPNSESASKH